MEYTTVDSASVLPNGNTFGWTDAADAVQAGKQRCSSTVIRSKVIGPRSVGRPFARFKGSPLARIDVGEKLDVLAKAALTDLVNPSVGRTRSGAQLLLA